MRVIIEVNDENVKDWVMSKGTKVFIEYRGWATVESIEEYVRVLQDIQCVEGKCPKSCNRCIKESDLNG